MNEAIQLLNSLLKQAAEIADELTPEEMEQVLAIFKDAVEILSQQGQQETGPISPTQTPELPTGEYPSSNVEGFKYDQKNGRLFIQFHGPYPQSKGPIYSYEGVPEFIYKVLERGAVGPKTSGRNQYHQWKKGITPSYGAAVNALIKAGGYPYKKLS